MPSTDVPDIRPMTRCADCFITFITWAVGGMLVSVIKVLKVMSVLKVLQREWRPVRMAPDRVWHTKAGKIVADPCKSVKWMHA